MWKIDLLRRLLSDEIIKDGKRLKRDGLHFGYLDAWRVWPKSLPDHAQTLARGVMQYVHGEHPDLIESEVGVTELVDMVELMLGRVVPAAEAM
jgi:hypothetical protein